MPPRILMSNSPSPEMKDVMRVIPFRTSQQPTVLCVDDEAAALQLRRQVLEKAGFEGGRTKFLAQAKNSSSLAATDVHAQVDMFGTTGAMGFDRGVTTNGDITLDTILSTGTSGQAIVLFSDPFALSSV